MFLQNSNLGAGNLTPLGLFFIIFGIGCAWGWETGYASKPGQKQCFVEDTLSDQIAVNLARDFGPRLMTYFLGYGTEVFKAGGYYFWIPMVAPFFGCTFG